MATPLPSCSLRDVAEVLYLGVGQCSFGGEIGVRMDLGQENRTSYSSRTVILAHSTALMVLSSLAAPMPSLAKLSARHFTRE